MSGGVKAPRFGRFLRAVVTAVAALGAFIATPACAQQPQRIVAVGDLHGDFNAWSTVARASSVANAAGHWAGGRTTLVQMGDILDRGPDSLKIVRNLQQLQKEAPRAGGRVIVVLGNHEAMNLLGDFRYTTPGEYAAMADGQSSTRRDRVYAANRAQIEAAAKTQNPQLTPAQIRASWDAQHPLGWVERRLTWSPSGELGKWATGNSAIVRIGETLFVHGGLSAEYAKASTDDINRRVAAAMASGDDSPATILYDPLGPLWYRGLVTRDPDAETARAQAKPPLPHLTPEQELDAVLKAYGAKRLVIGHTPSLKGIQISADGRLARIDTGISKYYGGPPSWLEIIGDRMIPHTVPRSP